MTEVSRTPPATLADTRLALHRLAAYVIAPVRYAATERFGLRATPDGFGTPPFGDDRQIRVVGTTILDRVGDAERAAPITTLRAAADFLGTEVNEELTREHDGPEAGDVDEPLGVADDASRFLGSWFDMAFTALDALRSDGESVDASIAQLWPGHFDAAIEVGDPRRRGSYGASPGDHAVPEPYLYVSVWDPDGAGIDRTDAFWNATSFPGRLLPLSSFPVGDPATIAVDFWRRTRLAIG